MAVKSDFDTAGIVFENYIAWKGMPVDIAKPPVQAEYLSPSFRILEYGSNNSYRVYCTVGASYRIIPHSQAGFKSERGVRYEYILHASPRFEREVFDLLLMIASYPFKQNFMYYAGCVLPVGAASTVVDGSKMEYLYFTYPYLDDPQIYDSQPRGQIKQDDLLIQTLWVFPIYRSEAEYIQTKGVDEWENSCYARNTQAYDLYDFFRSAMV